MMTEMTKDPLTEPAGGANPASAGGEDDLGAYFRELRQYPRLSPQEERELAVACAAGDPAALRRMVQCNLRLVVSVAREYAGRGVPLMDLIQEGNIGLIVAARKFDYTRELRFSTYATKWIRQGITRCLMNHAGLIRVPIHTAERMRAILAARSAYVQAHGQEPDMDRLADYLLIMENGKLSKCDTTEQLNDDYTDITGNSARHIRDLLELEHRGGAQ